MAIPELPLECKIKLKYLQLLGYIEAVMTVQSKGNFTKHK